MAFHPVHGPGLSKALGGMCLAIVATAAAYVLQHEWLPAVPSPGSPSATYGVVTVAVGIALGVAASQWLARSRPSGASAHVLSGRLGLFSEPPAPLTAPIQMQAPGGDPPGHLVASVAHDFNNLLTVIGGHAEIARADVADPESQRHLDAVLSAALRAKSLTRQLVAHSRLAHVDPPPLELDAALASMTSFAGGLAGDEIEVVVTLGAPGARVKISPDHLAQVVLNLAANARDAMPTGGTITITSSILDGPGPGKPARTPQMGDEPYVLMAMDDTGVGMDPAVQQRLFQPYFTTKTEPDSGLGLATVCGIVNLCGGHIWVESTLGRGSRFTIGLPQVQSRGTHEV